MSDSDEINLMENLIRLNQQIFCDDAQGTIYMLINTIFELVIFS